MLLINNSNLSCKPGGPANTLVLNEGSLLALRVIQTLSFLLLFTLSLLLNSFVVFLVVKSKILHQRTFYLALQIAVGNIVRSIVLFPPSLITAITSKWVFGDAGCQTIALVNTWVQSTRWLLMFVFSLDVFCTTLFPFRYPKRNNSRPAVTLSVATWTVSLLLSVLPLQGILGCYLFSFETGSCFLSSDICNRQYVCTRYIEFYYTFISIFGGVMPFIFYLLLLCKALQLKNAKRTRITPLTANYDIQSAQKSGFKMEDFRGIFTFFILLIALLGSTLPINILCAIRVNIFESGAGSEIPTFAIYLKQMLIIVWNSVVVVDAIAILRNRDTQRAIRKLKHSLHRNTVRPTLI